MSDGFDKEAEREKLREKFADDEEEREHTQRMSELLLKGATMTNRHCEECGDPIFRHDGREFCPTCGNEVGGGAGDGEAPADAEGTPDAAVDADGTPNAPADATPDASAAASDGVDASANGSVDSPDADVADDGSVDAGAAAPVDTAGAGRSSPSAADSDGRSDPPQSSESQPRSSPQRSGSEKTAPQRPAQSVDHGESVGTARASLTRTLTRFARAAEAADDPRRARDNLEAAREAAEALAALD